MYIDTFLLNSDYMVINIYCTNQEVVIHSAIIFNCEAALINKEEKENLTRKTILILAIVKSPVSFT